MEDTDVVSTIHHLLELDAFFTSITICQTSGLNDDGLERVDFFINVELTEEMLCVLVLFKSYGEECSSCKK